MKKYKTLPSLTTANIHFVKAILLTFIFHCPQTCFAQYLIQGQVDSSFAYRYASLDIVRDWNAFQSVDSELVVKKVEVKQDGSFEFSGNELSLDDGFYRVRYTRDKKGVMISNLNMNYVNFVLSNQDTIQIHNTSFLSNRDVNKRLALAIEQNKTFYINQKNADLELQDKMILKKHQEYCRKSIQQSENGLLNVYNLYSGEFTLEEDLDLFVKVLIDLDSPTLQDSYHTSLSKLLHIHEFVSKRHKLNWIKIVLTLSLGLNGILLFLFFKNKSSNEKKVYQSDIRSLTNKETEVLQWIEKNKTNKEIAAKLFVSEATIKTHINNIYRKLNVKSRKEAINQLKNQKSTPV